MKVRFQAGRTIYEEERKNAVGRTMIRIDVQRRLDETTEARARFLHRQIFAAHWPTDNKQTRTNNQIVMQVLSASVYNKVENPAFKTPDITNDRIIGRTKPRKE